MVKRFLPFLTLFTSLATLICCALPALLVSLGLGATLVSVLGTFPQLIWLSEHKSFVFGTAGSLLLISYLAQRFAEDRTCPVDPTLALACKRTRRVSTFIFVFSVVVYGVGAFFAFVAPTLF